MRRERRVDVDDGRLAVWTRGGDGPCVLLLHGGPGLSDYLEGLADERGDGWNIAGYQQRGLAPSTEDGPFTVARHVADARAVLEALGWQRAYAIGHSWGGISRCIWRSRSRPGSPACWPSTRSAASATVVSSASARSSPPARPRRTASAPRRSTNGPCAA